MKVEFFIYKRRTLPLLSVSLFFGNGNLLCDITFQRSFIARGSNYGKHVFAVQFITPLGYMDRISEYKSISDACRDIDTHIERWFNNSPGADYLSTLVRKAMRSESLGASPTTTETRRHALFF